MVIKRVATATTCPQMDHYCRWREREEKAKAVHPPPSLWPLHTITDTAKFAVIVHTHHFHNYFINENLSSFTWSVLGPLKVSIVLKMAENLHVQCIWVVYQIEKVCGVHIYFSAQTVLCVAVMAFTINDVWGGWALKLHTCILLSMKLIHITMELICIFLILSSFWPHTYRLTTIWYTKTQTRDLHPRL